MSQIISGCHRAPAWKRWLRPFRRPIYRTTVHEAAHTLKAHVAGHDGYIAKRPGGIYDATLLGVDEQPAVKLGVFGLGRDVFTTVDAEGVDAGAVGRIARIVLFRESKPIGVRMSDLAWGPLVWFDPWELRLVPEVAVFVAASPEAPTLALLALGALADADTVLIGRAR